MGWIQVAMMMMIIIIINKTRAVKALMLLVLDSAVSCCGYGAISGYLGAALNSSHGCSSQVEIVTANAVN
jgi:uncharacterized membrane protein